MEQNERFEEIIKNRQRFNGEPYKHWKDKAEEHVMECLVRAALHNTCDQSLIGYVARKRLLAIAEAVNPDLLQEVLKQRELCMSGFATTLVKALGSGG